MTEPTQNDPTQQPGAASVQGAPDPAPGAVEPPKASKAGRNLPVAIAAGIGLGGVAALSLIFAKWVFAIVGVAAVWLGVVEVNRALRKADVRVSYQPILVALPILAFVAYQFGPAAHLTGISVLVLFLMAFRLTFGIEGYVKDISASILVTAYLPLMLGFAILTLAAPDGAALIATFILLTVGSDIGGYAAGVLFGKHPMAPSISPKKSWEGFAGSLLAQAVLGALLFAFLLDAPWWQGVVVGVIMTFTATLGDFIESAIKRDIGVKDMGDIVPGHGGIMDRLDSLIPNAFVSWALFTLFLGI